VWGGLVLWLLMGHQFTARKREKVIGDGIYNDNVAGADIVKSVVDKGCCNVKELVPVGGGMGYFFCCARLGNEMQSY